MKLKKLSILMGVGLMTYLSTLGQTNLVQTQAALTKPTLYDYSYEYQSSTSRFEYTTQSGQSRSSFTRTIDGAYFNYTQTDRSLWVHPDFDGVNNNQYLSVDTIFTRSNTTWNSYTAFGGAPTRYEPTSTNIGSNSSVGTISQKTYFQFNNQTPNNYYLYLDHSSTGNNGRPWTLEINDLNILTWDGLGVAHTTNILMRLYLSSFSKLEFFSSSNSNAIYFDAWYLEDLGVSSAYQQGYDDGDEDGYQDGLNNNPNLLVNGFEAMVGILINMVFMVLNLSVFDVSLLNIFGIIVLFVGIIWILRLIRG
jgi:hypothetical protein